MVGEVLAEVEGIEGGVALDGAEPGDEDVEVVEREDGEAAADEAAQEAHRGAAKGEDGGDAFLWRSHRLQDGDFSSLVVDEEDEERDDVAAGDEEDDSGDEGEEGFVAAKLLQEIFGEFVFVKGGNFPILGNAGLFKVEGDFFFECGKLVERGGPEEKAVGRRSVGE